MYVFILKTDKLFSTHTSKPGLAQFKESGFNHGLKQLLYFYKICMYVYI